MVEIARALKQRLGPAAKKVSTRALPNFLIRLMARRNPALRGIVPLLGVRLDATGAKAKRLLGWTPRSPEQAIVASAESLIRLGLVNARG